MVTALLVGLVVGFVLAIPPGPLAIACISQALAGQARESVALALSASAMDIGYALLAAFASSALVGALRGLVTDNAWALLAFQGGCIVVLVVLGLRYCRPPRGRRTSPAGRAGPHA
jgi:threonine/homoserine/homoserine lactone efflux protein